MSARRSIPATSTNSSESLAGSIPGQRYVPQMAMLMGESRSPPLGPVKPTNMGGVDTCGLFNFSIPAKPDHTASATAAATATDAAAPASTEPVAADLPRLWKLTKAYLPKSLCFYNIKPIFQCCDVICFVFLLLRFYYFL